MTNSTFNGKSKSYLELVTNFPPRSITSDAELHKVEKVIDVLLDQDGLSPDGQDYLDVLGLLVKDYEERIQIKIPDIYGVELLKALIKDRGLRQKELVHIFKTESIISAILKGQRRLTVEHIKKLAEYFHVSPSAFFPLEADLASEA